MEHDNGSLSWLQGLEEFLEFKNDQETKKFVEFLLKLLYSETPILNHSNAAGMVYAISQLRKYAKNDIFDAFHKYYRYKFNPTHLADAFSRGQVSSKIWLVTELAKVQHKFDNIVILAGWYGQLVKYFDNIEFKKIRNIDIDQTACLISDDIFNLELIQDYKVKAVCADIQSLTLTKKGYEFQIENFKNNDQKKFPERFLPNLIINTSAEHMTEDWFNSIRFKELESNPIVVIQSNNLFDIEEHVNCVHSIDHMKKKFPMQEILYEGELQFQGYKRIMLIGKHDKLR